jgi:hypothetical protein
MHMPGLLLAEGYDRRHTNQGGNRLRVRLGVQQAVAPLRSRAKNRSEAI